VSRLTPQQQAASLKFRPHLIKATQLLDRACRQMRLFEALFDQHDELKSSMADADGVVLETQGFLAGACTELFDTTGDEPEAAMADTALTRLWEAHSIVALCHGALSTGSFGGGGIIVDKPVQHAMGAALSIVTRLRPPLDRYVASLPPAKAKAVRS
jgi:hypothetical protein